MRTLNRPMFNMGGPIKQGVMHGIREPYKGGGAALVGNPAFPKTGGREHHFTWIPSAAQGIARVAPWAMKLGRGLKTGRAFPAGKMGAWGRLKNIMSPSGRFRDYKGKIPLGGTGTTRGQLVPYGAGVDTSGKMGLWQSLKDPTRLGMAIRENPLTSLGLGYTALGVPRNVPDILGAGWDATKWTGRKVRDQIFGDTFKEPPPPTGVTLPGGGETSKGSGAAYYSKAGKGELKPLTKAQQEKWADAQRGKRLNNLLDIMGYDRSKKTAIADALIDASKIVSDRGTLDKKNITRDLINPIIQATSKRLDKPDQIREAVGLMMAKGEIEKDLYKWKPGTHLKNAQDMADTLGIPIEEAFRRTTSQASTLGQELQALQVLKKSTALTATDIEKQTRIWANKTGKEFKEVITTEMLKGKEDKDPVEIVQALLTGDATKDDGFYQVGTDVIEVRNGVPKQEW